MTDSKQRYYIWVLGCAMNYSDAERMMAVLESLGYQKTTTETEADLIIVVSCSVRQSAINRIYGKAVDWKKLKIKNKELKIGLTGCVLEKDRPKMEKIFDFIFEIVDLDRIKEFLNPDLIRNSKFKIQNSGDYLNIIPKYESPFRAYVPISTGCDNFCTYCAVPYARGREKSRPLKEIVDEVKDLVEKGYKEITLLGQNVNSYGKAISDKKTAKGLAEGERQMTNDEEPFITLLKSIDRINGDYRVYFYSNHPKDMTDELIEVLPKLKHFPAYIHLPLQSGNDEIIKKMNRHYTKEKYLRLVKKIRKALPDVVLTTDIIVGFPGESEGAFADTIEVMEKAKFDMAFIAQYSPRPGTAAAKLVDDVSKEEKKVRDKKLVDLLAKTALENNKKMIGTTQNVLIDGEKNGKFYGRTQGYKVVEIENRNYPKGAKRVEGSRLERVERAEEPPVVIPSVVEESTGVAIGQFISVKITDATAWKLSG